MSVSILFLWLICFSLSSVLCLYSCILFVLINVCWNVSKPMNEPPFVVSFLWKNVFQVLKYWLKNIILVYNWQHWGPSLFYAIQFWQFVWQMLWLKNIYFKMLLVIYCLIRSFPLRYLKYQIKCLPIFLEPHTISIWSTWVFKGVFGEFGQVLNNLKKQTDGTLYIQTNKSSKELNKIKCQSQFSLESIQMSIFMLFKLLYILLLWIYLLLKQEISIMWLIRAIGT